MSWRRKRSKGSWTNPVKGAMVINKGGGGGEMPQNKPRIEDLEMRKAMKREERSLTTVSNKEHTPKKWGKRKRNLRIVTR